MSGEKLPVTSARKIIRALERLGFSRVKQRGSHVKMRRNGVICVVPNYKEVGEKILSRILKQAGVSRKEFMDAYRKKK